MPFRTFKPYVAKARTRVPVRATQRRVEALNKRMESVVSRSFTEGANKLRDTVRPDKLMDAFKKGDYKPLLAQLPRDKKEITEAFRKTADDIEHALGEGAKIAKQGLTASIQQRLEYTAENPRTAKFISDFSGTLAQNMSDDMLANVRSAVQDQLVNGTPIADTAEQIRQSIGLNNRQAIALQNFKGTAEDKAAYADKLLDDRSRMIARTEVAYAQNEANLQVWDEAQDQGLIGQNATKIWMVDGAPCKYCEPLDGQEVSLDEPFVTDDGEEIYAPPYHTNCLCCVVLGSTE